MNAQGETWTNTQYIDAQKLPDSVLRELSRDYVAYHFGEAKAYALFGKRIKRGRKTNAERLARAHALGTTR